MGISDGAMSLTKENEREKGSPASLTDTTEASQIVRATKPKKARRVAVRSSADGRGEDCTNVAHERLAEKPSYAVPPSMTATVGTRPRWPRRPLTPCSGVRSTPLPSWRRPSGESRPSSRDHASKGSAWSNHVRPKTAAPSSDTAKKPATRTRRKPSDVLSSATSSTHVKVPSPRAAGHRPQRYGRAARSGETRARRSRPACSARSGLRTRHTGPRSIEEKASPTHSHA